MDWLAALLLTGQSVVPGQPLIVGGYGFELGKVPVGTPNNGIRQGKPDWVWIGPGDGFFSTVVAMAEPSEKTIINISASKTYKSGDVAADMKACQVEFGQIKAVTETKYGRLKSIMSGSWDEATAAKPTKFFARIVSINYSDRFTAYYPTGRRVELSCSGEMSEGVVSLTLRYDVGTDWMAKLKARQEKAKRATDAQQAIAKGLDPSKM